MKDEKATQLEAKKNSNIERYKKESPGQEEKKRKIGI
jgi:hypothetical protein